MGDNNLIRRGDALDAAPHCSFCDWHKAIAALPAVTVGEPTEAQIASACLSYDHSFGLMDGPQRVALKHKAREWLHAWRKEFAALEPVTQPAPEPAPSDAGAATYGLPAPQSGEVPASSAPTPAPAAQLDAGAIREAALREVLALKRHGSTVPYDPTEFIDVDDVLALLTEADNE